MFAVLKNKNQKTWQTHGQKNGMNENVGGPKDIGSLFSIEEIKADFENYEIEELEEIEIDLNEGLYHNGLGSVIRFLGRKKISRI